MLPSFFYLAFVSLLRLVAGRRRSEFAKDVELPVFIDILNRRQSGPFARLELKRWVLEDPGSPGEQRPTYPLS